MQVVTDALDRPSILAALFQQSVDDVIQLLAMHLLSPADKALLLEAQAFGNRATLAVVYRTPDFHAVEGIIAEAQSDQVPDAGGHDAFAVVLPRQPVAEVAGVVRLVKLVIAQDARDLVPIEDRDVPRLAVFSTWGGTQEVGWVRYALDRYGVAYDLIFKERVRQGALRSAYDVIVIPSQGGSGRRLVFDLEPKSKPLAYRKSDRFKFLGMYGETADMSGGLGKEGIEAFTKFLEAGGTLIAASGAIR